MSVLFKKVLTMISMVLIVLSILVTGAFAANDYSDIQFVFAKNYTDMNFVYEGVTYTVRYDFNEGCFVSVHDMPESIDPSLNDAFDGYTEEYSGFLSAKLRAMDAYVDIIGVPPHGDNSTPMWVWILLAGCIGGLIMLVHRKIWAVARAESKAIA